MSEYKEFTDRMEKTCAVLVESFNSVRAGRANAAVLDKITVEYYGTATPIQQLATISTPDPRTLAIQPWDTSVLKLIKKAIETSDPHEVELVKFTADYIHSKGYYFIWIPYYQSSGFTKWKSYGFDAAVMQPNYMFDLEQSTSRLEVTSTRLKWMHMCVEIEHNFEAFADPLFLRNYMLYLYRFLRFLVIPSLLTISLPALPFLYLSSKQHLIQHQSVIR